MGKRFPGFCQLASVLTVNETEASVKKLHLTALCTYIYSEVKETSIYALKGILSWKLDCVKVRQIIPARD